MKRLIIFRPDNLGDLVLFSGALRVLRRYFSGYHIILCAKAYVHAYFEHCPYIDEYLAWEDIVSGMNETPDITWYPRRWRGHHRLQVVLGKWNRIKMRKRLRCETLLVPVRSPQPAWSEYIREIPATKKIGLVGNVANCKTPHEHAQYARTLTDSIDCSDLSETDHEFKASVRLLQHLGVSVTEEEIWPEYWTTSEDATAVERIKAREQTKLVVIAPGKTSFASGVLSPFFYSAAFSESLKIPVTIRVVGTAAERESCDATVAALKGLPMVREVISIAGETSIRETIELCKRASVVISLETATLHVAVMLRRPVIGLVGGGHYGRFFPWGISDVTRGVIKPMECFGCNWKCKFEEVRCLSELDPRAVSSNLQELLVSSRD